MDWPNSLTDLSPVQIGRQMQRSRAGRLSAAGGADPEQPRVSYPAKQGEIRKSWTRLRLSVNDSLARAAGKIPTAVAWKGWSSSQVMPEWQRARFVVTDILTMSTCQWLGRT